MATHDNCFSLAEAARILQCDDKYIEAMATLGRIRTHASPNGDLHINADAIAAFRDETWDGIRDMMLGLLDTLQEQHIDMINESLQSAVAERSKRSARRTTAGCERFTLPLSLVDVQKRRR
ncbi:hypothetical protein [Paraburkholderia pallida]|uniref:DNA binding domain-containing protein, excisionase family n=1 Tax=Paraburkholderia pallida TaxID=2547399 RepID=A0A4P7D1M8_9BURK|nr:hypothetical protein [Paraburkholderia pallida]QBR02506.1 hypothetical protein E1956_35285 [Paraburkholderia pallida]